MACGQGQWSRSASFHRQGPRDRESRAGTGDTFGKDGVYASTLILVMVARTSVTEDTFDSAIRRPAKSDSENDRLWNGKRPLPPGNRAESRRAQHVRSTSDSDRIDASQRTDAKCQSRRNAPQQKAPLFDHVRRRRRAARTSCVSQPVRDATSCFRRWCRSQNRFAMRP